MGVWMPMVRRAVHAFAKMTVCMYVLRATVVRVDMKVHTAANESAQHVSPQQNQHDANAKLQRLGHVRGNGLAERQNDATKNKQCDGVAYAPRDALLHGLTQRMLARRERGNRREMIGLGRMFHSKQKAQKKDTDCSHGAVFTLWPVARSPRSQSYHVSIPSPVVADTRNTRMSGFISRA